MSNILIIKLGSLGDLIQANGAIKDIKSNFPNDKVLLLTSESYTLFMSSCPYIDGVITDKRLPRWNIFYLSKLKRLLESYNFTHVFDLQNSARTYFYRKFILRKPKWSSTEEALDSGQNKKDFDQEGVLPRMEIQLNKTGVETKYLKSIDLSWAKSDISKLIKQYTNDKWINASINNNENVQINKYYIDEINKFDKFTTQISNYFSSEIFINWLSNITNIPDLEWDKDLTGGGIHKTTKNVSSRSQR